MENLLVVYLGLKTYNDVLIEQESHFNKLIDEKKVDGSSHSDQHLILCQHYPVYTLGKNGKMENLLPLAKSSGAEFVQTNRGGDITFHGPGQLVGYPIIDLERQVIGLAKYIDLIEESIIRTIGEFNIRGERYSGASGVWLDIDNPSKIRKICALGIRSSRWITMHGFALNVSTDLHFFDLINPCGFQDKGVTSMEKELGKEIDFDLVAKTFTKHFSELFQFKLVNNVREGEKA